MLTKPLAGLALAGIFVLILLSGLHPLSAETSGLMPAIAEMRYNQPAPDSDDTHPELRITSDKSELVRLDRDAASIIIGNPNHLGVLMDNRRLLILVPRQPGATYMTVLDAQGQVIMQRHVVASAPASDYVRVRRSCAGQDNCEPTSIYYCKGLCHEVGIVETADTGNIEPIPASGYTNIMPDGDTSDSSDRTDTELSPTAIDDAEGSANAEEAPVE